MAPKKRDVTADDLTRWAQLRAESSQGYVQHLASGPGPDAPLDQLAWVAGADVAFEYPFDNDLRLKIEHARDQRYTWREISAALGEGDDEVNARRVKDKQAWRNKTYNEYQASQTH